MAVEIDSLNILLAYVLGRWSNDDDTTVTKFCKAVEGYIEGKVTEDELRDAAVEVTTSGESDAAEKVAKMLHDELWELARKHPDIFEEADVSVGTRLLDELSGEELRELVELGDPEKVEKKVEKIARKLRPVSSSPTSLYERFHKLANDP